jgi:ASC-1-like (ASCH) protein
MNSRPAATTGVRAREMNLYRPYFDMVAAGRKTIEIRVEYPKLRNLQVGDHIRFICGRDDARTQVKRVARYTSFEEMLDAEGALLAVSDRRDDRVGQVAGVDEERPGHLADR